MGSLGIKERLVMSDHKHEFRHWTDDLWLCYLQVPGLWENYLISVCLSFLMCKTRVPSFNTSECLQCARPCFRLRGDSGEDVSAFSTGGDSKQTNRKLIFTISSRSKENQSG